MIAVGFGKEYTPEDLLLMDQGPRYELMNGRLVERPMGAKASLIAVALTSLLGPYARSKRLGLIFGSDCGYQCFASDPNASFFRTRPLSGWAGCSMTYRRTGISASCRTWP
jgi:Putative restriction endonuclease